MLRKLKFIFLIFIALIFSFHSSVQAATIHGKTLDEKNQPLPFSTITIKELNKKIVSNGNGEYSIELSPGTYTFVCQHVGYATFTKEVHVHEREHVHNFHLKPNELTLKEVIIKTGREDPAYAIIRNAIKERSYNGKKAGAYSCEAYIKGLIRTNDYPNTLLGQTIDFEDGDTSKKKIIFLSESISDIFVTQANESKVVVKSTRVSGQTNGLGLATPFLLSFYENIVALPKSFNPRGFISPIADGALAFYNYKYLGAFYENNVMINKILVTPKRNFEPLFKGYIQIIENTWNIHSVSLSLNKQSLLEFADKITIEQQYEKVDFDTWMVGSQTIYPEVKFLGFDAGGYFTTLFSKYQLNQQLEKKDFGKVLLKYDSLSNKKSLEYWETARPIPLLTEEIVDFRKKDSLEKRREDPAYLDSLDRRQNKLNAFGLIVNGQTLINRNRKLNYTYDPLLKSVSYNTVEGLALQLSGSLQKELKGRNQLTFTPVLRYGMTNRHFNAFLRTNYRFGKKYVNNINTSFGTRVFQFNNANPIPQIMNTFATILKGNNYMKLYQANFFQMSYQKGVGDGFDFTGFINYQDRTPLVNTDTSYAWGNSRIFDKFTPNYPTEIVNQPMKAHQNFVIGFRINFRPGTKYIELPDRVISSFSRTPTFSFQYSKAIKNILGSDNDFDKWRFSITGDINMKLGGEFRYRFETGGFINAKTVEVPDYNHFIGNLTRKSTPYVESFQVAPFYALSNKDKIFLQLNGEYRLNGLLTNKIPLIRRLNLRVVTGVNAIWLKDKNYTEVFVGVDNILKLFRFDYVWGMGRTVIPQNGIKIGIRGFSTLFTDY
ncbi:MAG: hypothetical protein RL000_480 [Bacteroidota bacterium]